MAVGRHNRRTVVVTLDRLFDEYIDRRSLSQPLDEAMLETVCHEAPQFREQVRGMILDAHAGAELLRPLKDPAISTLHLTHPNLLGDIRLETLRGSGGYGCVYRAVQRLGEAEEREVAVKFFPHDVFRQESFDREVSALKALKNAKNIPKLHTAGQHAGYWYFVSDWVSGHSLDDVIKTERRRRDAANKVNGGVRNRTLFSQKDIEVILVGILNALQQVRDEYAQTSAGHLETQTIATGGGPQSDPEQVSRRGNKRATRSAMTLVHGDLKPANVILRDHENGIEPTDAWVVDFGIAQAGAAISGFTEAYASPEMLTPVPQRADRQLSPQSDIFQVGLIGYELVTGTPYWETEPGNRANGLKGAPWKLRTCLRHALNWDPTKRYGSVEAFRQEIEQSAARHLLRRFLRNRWSLQVACALAVIVAIGVGIWSRNSLTVIAPPEKKVATPEQTTTASTEKNKDHENDNAPPGPDQDTSSPELDARVKYRSLRDAFNKDLITRLGDRTWREETKGDLSSYLNQYKKIAEHPVQIQNAKDWLAFMDDSPVNVRIWPEYLEEFLYVRDADVGFKILSGDNQESYRSPVNVNQRKDLTAEEKNSLQSSAVWRPGDRILLQLHNKSGVVCEEDLGGKLTEMILHGDLKEPTPFLHALEDKDHNWKVTFGVMITRSLYPPPRLP
jgi:serine/threonine protein kinase